MPDPTTGLTPTQRTRYRTLLDALGDVPATEEERRTLAWLTGYEADTVTHLAAMLRRARRSGLDALRAALVAAGYGDEEEVPLSLNDLAHFAERGVLPEGETDA